MAADLILQSKVLNIKDGFHNNLIYSDIYYSLVWYKNKRHGSNDLEYWDTDGDCKDPGKAPHEVGKFSKYFLGLDI